MKTDMNINTVLRNAIIVGIFAIPFIFLPAFNMETFFPFIVGKNFTFRIITGIIVLLWLVLAFRDEKYLPKNSWLAKAVLAFTVVMGLATIFSENPFKSFWSNFERMEGFITILHLAGYFFVTSSIITTRRLWNNLFHTSLGMSLFMGLFVLLQLGGELAINQSTTRVDGTLGNSAYLAVYVLIHLFLAAYYFVGRDVKEDARHILDTAIVGFSVFFIYYPIHLLGAEFTADTRGTILTIISLIGASLAAYFRFGSRSGKVPLVARLSAYVVLMGLLSYVLVKTETRGAVLGFGVAAFFVSVIFAFFQKERKDLKKIGIGALVLVILFFGGLGALKESSFVKESSALSRIASFITFDLKNLAATEGKARFAIWGTAFDGFLERPILGWGQESFNYVFYKHYNPKMYNQEAWFDRAHNVFLDWLIAGGILGLAGYLALFVACLWYLWRRKASTSFSFEEKIVLTGLFIAYFIHNLFVFDNIGSYILFFTILAFFHVSYAKDEEFSLHRFAKKQKDVLISIGVPAVIVIGIFGIYYFNVPGLNGAFSLNQALAPQAKGLSENVKIFKGLFESKFIGTYEAREQITIAAMRLVSVNVDPSFKTELFNIAYSELKKQLIETPKDARYWYFMGGLLSSYGRLGESVAVWQEAVKLAPKKQIMLFALGSTYLNLGNKEAAIEAYKQAYEVYPGYDEAAIQYFDLSGQKEKVLELVKARYEAEPKDINRHFSYVVALYGAGKKQLAIDEVRKIVVENPDLKAQGDEIIKQIQQNKLR